MQGISYLTREECAAAYAEWANAQNELGIRPYTNPNGQTPPHFEDDLD